MLLGYRQKSFLSIHHGNMSAAEIDGEWKLAIYNSSLGTNKVLDMKLIVTEAFQQVVVGDCSVAFHSGTENLMVGKKK